MSIQSVTIHQIKQQPKKSPECHEDYDAYEPENGESNFFFVLDKVDARCCESTGKVIRLVGGICKVGSHCEIDSKQWQKELVSA
ncbi:MAG TPA: hypothetical protein VGJ72_05715 [Polaromonas sp.]|jgi:hypothetical protein